MVLPVFVQREAAVSVSGRSICVILLPLCPVLLMVLGCVSAGVVAAVSWWRVGGGVLVAWWRRWFSVAAFWLLCCGFGVLVLFSCLEATLVSLASVFWWMLMVVWFRGLMWVVLLVSFLLAAPAVPVGAGSLARCRKSVPDLILVVPLSAVVVLCRVAAVLLCSCVARRSLCFDPGVDRVVSRCLVCFFLPGLFPGIEDVFLGCNRFLLS
jgi:hypothetical protein